MKGAGEGLVKAGSRNQEGVDGASIHGGDDGMSGQMVKTQSADRITAHGRADGGRSHDSDLAGDIRGMTGRDGAVVRISQGADGEPMELSNTAGTGGQGGAATMSIRGRTRLSED